MGQKVKKYKQDKKEKYFHFYTFICLYNNLDFYLSVLPCKCHEIDLLQLLKVKFMLIKRYVICTFVCRLGSIIVDVTNSGCN